MSNAETLARETVLEVRDTCLCLRAQRAARALARRFDTALRPLGLNNGQFSMLMALHRPEPWAIGDLADMLAMDRTTLTAKLKPLVRRGLIEVAVDPADRRGRRVAITADGRRLMVEAYPIWAETHADLDADLDAALPDFDSARLRHDLDALA